MRNSELSVYDQLIAAFGRAGSPILSRAEIVNTLTARFGTNPRSIFPSDYCYNRWNLALGRQRWRPLFVHVAEGSYRYVGPHHRYSGDVMWRPLGNSVDQKYGEWIEGTFTPVMGSSLKSKRT
jgi:hypothetical protein